MRARIRLTLLTSLLIPALATCGGSDPAEDNSPDHLVMVTDPGALVASGAAMTLQVRVVDVDDDPIDEAGVPVTLTLTTGTGVVGGPTVDSTDATGLTQFTDVTVTGPVGAHQFTFSSPGLTSVTSATFTITAGAADSIFKVTGDAQSANVGDTLAVRPRVRVIDAAGNPVQGVGVTFTVAEGGGTVQNGGGQAGATLVNTDASGNATARWTLGAIGANTLEVTSAGVPGAGTLTFSATGTVPPGFSAATDLTPDAAVGTAAGPTPTVRLASGGGAPIAGVVIHFAVTGGTLTGDSAITDSAGLARPTSWVLDTLVGVDTLTATTGGFGPIRFIATAGAGPADTIIALSSDLIEGFVNDRTSIGVTIQVKDQYGNLLAGRPFTTSFASGGGTGGTGGTLDGTGSAYVASWLFGGTPGAATVRITVDALNRDLPAAARTVTGYDILLRNVDPAYVETFRRAAYKWRRRITGDLADLTGVNVPAGTCGSAQQAIVGNVDDLIIDVALEPIDGVGGILGQAGPCFIRNSDQTPLHGVMRFDVADLATMVANGTINDVILHEMGHVLGVGSLWRLKNLLADTLTSNPVYTGAQGMTGYEEISGSGQVPVENGGGAGTRLVHWRESTMPHELMSGFIGGPGNPLSILTLRSLMDVGYSIDASLAESYTVGAAPPALPGQALVPFKIEEIVTTPRFTVDPTGKVTPIP